MKTVMTIACSTIVLAGIGTHFSAGGFRHSAGRTTDPITTASIARPDGAYSAGPVRSPLSCGQRSTVYFKGAPARGPDLARPCRSKG